jgi:hypothetical protein
VATPEDDRASLVDRERNAQRAGDRLEEAVVVARQGPGGHDRDRGDRAASDDSAGWFDHIGKVVVGLGHGHTVSEVEAGLSGHDATEQRYAPRR